MMFLFVLLGLLALIVTGLAVMIAFGTGAPPPPRASIGKAFANVDFRDLPPVEKIPGRDGSTIAFRHWPESPPADAPERAVIAIHGSSATSSSLHPLAKALAAAGIPVYAPDIRGHGDTGRRGDINYAGQLDDDFADLVTAVRARHTNAKLVLVGFSSGGGFALHAAASPLGTSFERTVLLSPMLGPRAPTARPDLKTWAKPFIPRIIAIALLNRIGIHRFDRLAVLAFATEPKNADLLTSRYSFLLMNAFATSDYAADLRHASAPIAVLVGEQDELFDASRFVETIAAIRTDIPVTVIPGLGHIEMTTDPRAIPAILARVRQ